MVLASVADGRVTGEDTRVEELAAVWGAARGSAATGRGVGAVGKDAQAAHARRALENAVLAREIAPTTTAATTASTYETCFQLPLLVPCFRTAK